VTYLTFWADLVVSGNVVAAAIMVEATPVDMAVGKTSMVDVAVAGVVVVAVAVVEGTMVVAAVVGVAAVGVAAAGVAVAEANGTVDMYCGDKQAPP